MRAGEEPLQADLGMKGLKAHVLEHIEVLEERGELMAELVPAMGG